MNTYKNPFCETAQSFSLKQLIKQLLVSYQPVAVKKHSFFVNDISDELSVHTDKDILCTLLGSLLYVTARLSRNNCIHISAAKSRGEVILYVKDATAIHNYAVLSGLQHLQLLADKLGGMVWMPQGNKPADILCSFPVAA